MAIPRLDHFIDGANVAPASGEYLSVHNPATGEVIAEVACGDAADVDRAVAAARRAFNDPAWREQTPAQRAALISRFINVIKQNAQELAYLEIISSGAMVSRVGVLDILMMVDACTVMADMVQTYPFTQTLPARTLPEMTDVKVIQEPIGLPSATIGAR